MFMSRVYEGPTGSGNRKNSLVGHSGNFKLRTHRSFVFGTYVSAEGSGTRCHSEV